MSELAPMPPARVEHLSRTVDRGDLVCGAAPPARPSPGVPCFVVQWVGLLGSLALMWWMMTGPGVPGALPVLVMLALQVPTVALMIWVDWVLSRPRRGLGLFRYAAVLDRPPSVLTGRVPAPDVLEWSDLHPVEHRRRPGGGASRSHPRRVVVIRDGAGRTLLRGNGRHAHQLAAVLGEVELERAGAALEAGEPVRYGPVTMTPQGIRIGRRASSWAGVRAVRLAGPWVQVVGADPGARPLARCRRSRVPHQRVLLALAGRLAAGPVAADPTGARIALRIVTRGS